MPWDGDRDRFADREDAGRRLASKLTDESVPVDIVLAIPRGGLPVGRIVADSLGVPLDIVVSSKIGAPQNPEYAIGAAASDGSVWLDQDTIDRLGVSSDYIEREQAREAEIAREKAETYRGDRSSPSLEGKSVVIVDDGVATGATAISAINLVKAKDAARVVLAVPVGPPGTISELESIADAVISVLTPSQFSAVGQFYMEFGQVSDEEAASLLRESNNEE